MTITIKNLEVGESRKGVTLVCDLCSEMGTKIGRYEDLEIGAQPFLEIWGERIVDEDRVRRMTNMINEAISSPVVV